MKLNNSKTAKFFAGAIGLSMALSFALPASAQTTAELTAQINSLLAMIAQLQAQIAGGTTTTGGASMSFTTDLTVGSKGADVTALQTWLVSKGYLVMPAGVAMGYFGPATKAALAKYQASAGISPAAGYFGPMTRAKLNAMGGTTTTGGTTTGGSTGITTPGVEGTLSVTSNSSGIESTIYEGDSAKAILGFNVEAKNSDISIQRVKLALGTATSIYNKIYSKIYITDGSNVLASSDLNSSTVIKDGSTYYITVAGFNLVVPKGSKKQIVVKADVRSQIDSGDLGSKTITLASNGIRGVDGAGIDQYAGDTSISKSVTVSATLVDSASLIVTLNTTSPKVQDVICAGAATENECDKLTLMTFDVKAEKDAVTITDINIAVAKTGTGTAVASSTVYLFDGATEVDNATVGSLNTAIFSDFDYTIPKDTTKTFTVKADIRSANANRASFIASASSTGITAENSVGDTVSTKSGTATGYSIGIRDVGPEITLVSKSITTNGAPQDNGVSTNVSTSTLTANFNIKVKAVGGAIEFGTNQSTSSPFMASTTGFGIYRNGVLVTDVGSNSTSTSITIPTTCTTSGFTNSCSLAEGSEVTIPVSFVFQGRTTTGSILTSGLYSIGVAQINWINPADGVSTNSTWMAGEVDWRTSDVSFP